MSKVKEAQEIRMTNTPTAKPFYTEKRRMNIEVFEVEDKYLLVRPDTETDEKVRKGLKEGNHFQDKEVIILSNSEYAEMVVEKVCMEFDIELLGFDTNREGIEVTLKNIDNKELRNTVAREFRKKITMGNIFTAWK